MQTVYLNGGISQFGERWETSCTNIGNIFKLIDCQTPGFRQYLVQAAEAGVDFQIQRGEELLSEPEELLLDLRDEDIIITEVPAGSKDGAAMIIAAIALTIVTAGAGMVALNSASALNAAGSAASLGGLQGATLSQGLQFAMTSKLGLLAVGVAANLALTGITQLLSPGPEVDAPGQNEDGYLFNGPVSRSPEGIVVPVVYGELIVGGQPISSAFKTGSPFADTSRVTSDNPFVDPDDGAILTTTGDTQPGDTATASPGGGGEIPPSDDQGIPNETAPTSYPDPRDEDRDNTDTSREEAPINPPGLYISAL